MRTLQVEVITQVKVEGWVIEDADLARLSPLICALNLLDAITCRAGGGSNGA